VTHWGEVFVNPNIIPRMADGKDTAPESCLSLPGKTWMVERFNTVQVDGKFYTGLHARIIQHEYDHLHGILIDTEGTPPEAFVTAARPRE
jgi:peptide deformylase